MKYIYLLVVACLGPFLLTAQSDFFDVSTIQDIQIEFEQDNWSYLLDSLRYNGEELLEGKVMINGQELAGVGVRYRGDRSFTPGNRRNGLQIVLNAYADDDQQYQGHHMVDLSSALRDPTLIREVLGYEIARNYMHAPGANYAKVMINSEPYGLFVNVEAVEGAFLERAFGTTQGALYYANPDIGNSPAVEGCGAKVFGSLQFEDEACLEHNFDRAQGESWTALHQLSRVLNENPQSLESMLDVDATLWMLAFNNLMINLNSYTGQYANNYYLFEDGDGRLVPVISGLNLAFGSFKNPGVGQSDWHTPQLIKMDPALHADNDNRPLIKALLSNEDYRMQYLSHYRTILVEELLSGRLENRARALQGMIEPLVMEDANQYYTNAEFQGSLTETTGERSRIPGLFNIMSKRMDWLEGQPVYRILPPSISKVEVEQRERFSSQRLSEFKIHAQVDGYPKQVFLYYRFAEDQPFQQIEMVDDGQHDDGEAGDRVYGAVAKPGTGQSAIQYYIMAENAKAVGYSPTRYTFELHRTNLTEINR